MRPPPGPVSAPSRQGAEGWFPWVVGFVALFLIVVWSGAALAAYVAGTAHVRIIDTGAALTQLPGHVADPAAAWPQDVARGLPGADIYWACQAAVVLFLAALTGGAWTLWRRILGERPGPLGVPNEAGLAGRRHLKRLLIDQPKDDRLTIGRCDGRLLACE